jgi:hypothetical protein
VPFAIHPIGAFSKNAKDGHHAPVDRRRRDAEFGEDRMTCFSTVDSDKNRACSIAGVGLPWAISRKTSSSRGVRELSGLAERVAAD